METRFRLAIATLPLLLSLLLPKPALAAVVASQTANWQAQVDVWQALQELGSNLTGQPKSFTFRVRTGTLPPYLQFYQQFDHTARNTRIYDKSAGNAEVARGCPVGGTYPSDTPRLGLTFSSQGVPDGFVDVAMDLSCNNYTFIPGHQYLIHLSQANMFTGGGSLIYFAGASYWGLSADYFPAGGLRYGHGNGFDWANNGGRCDPINYVLGSPKPSFGCMLLTTPKDDLYFILQNTSPEPKTPVVFIPGIGGSELKASQEIFWDYDNGHGGKFQRYYPANEKVWVNESEAVKLGDDDYFDVLKLKEDGVTAQAPAITTTGNLTPFGYSDTDAFFAGLGYTKGTDYFTFAYDWRKDIRSTEGELNSLVDAAIQKSGKGQVDIVAHSLGGLVARNYITNPTNAAKVNKLVGMGVPHLGSPKSLKTLMYGAALEKNLFGILPVGIPASEIRDISQNLVSLFTLLPHKGFYEDFYNNSNQYLPYPFSDDRDIDKNQESGPLSFLQTKKLLENLGYNMNVFNTAEQFHSLFYPSLNQSNGVKLYSIVGTGKPTLGQIRETWLVRWPINLIPIKDEFYINGDDTVPLYSASLKSDKKDLSSGAKIYYVEQKHIDLVNPQSPAMQTVKAILSESDSLPVEIKSEKIYLEGQHVSVDQEAELDLYDEEGNHTGLNDKGEVEANIPETFYDTAEGTKHAFIKKKSKKVTAKVKPKSKEAAKTNLKVRHYRQDKITKTAIYKDIPVYQTSKVELVVDPAVEASPPVLVDNKPIPPAAEVVGDNVLDQTPPQTKVEMAGGGGGTTVTLTSSDSGSGVLQTEYSLDNGQTVLTYSGPFTVTTPGTTTLQVKSIDKLGNEEIPREFAVSVTIPSPSPASVLTATSGFSSNTSSDTSAPPSTIDVLGVSIKNPFKKDVILEQASVAGEAIESRSYQPSGYAQGFPDDQVKVSSARFMFNRIIMAAVVVVGGLGLALGTTFLIKPTPK